VWWAVSLTLLRYCFRMGGVLGCLTRYPRRTGGPSSSLSSLGARWEAVCSPRGGKILKRSLALLARPVRLVLRPRLMVTMGVARRQPPLVPGSSTSVGDSGSGRTSTAPPRRVPHQPSFLSRQVPLRQKLRLCLQRPPTRRQPRLLLGLRTGFVSPSKRLCSEARPGCAGHVRRWPLPCDEVSASPLLLGRQTLQGRRSWS
jgi:hypothetical protein